MPGVGEINKVVNALKDVVASCDRKLKIFSLHGNLPPQEQRRVFAAAGPRELKIVVSTNVAEASITIPDVRIRCRDVSI
jgi:HrpA-like RNA helicase